MKWPIITNVKIFTNLSIFILCSTVQIKVHALELDLSRRQAEIEKSKATTLSKEVVPLDTVADTVEPTTPLMNSSPLQPQESVLTKVFKQITEPAQTIVIMNTESGFVPDTLRLRKGANYRIHVVNINDSKKNLSFTLDAFSEHHATYFGKDKSFDLSPKVDGVFSFQCPETAKQGKIVVYGDGREPASN